MASKKQDGLSRPTSAAHRFCGRGLILRFQTTDWLRFVKTVDPNAQFSQLHFDEPNESITRNAVTAQNGALGYTLDPVGNRQVLTSTLGALTAQSNTFDANDRMAADTYDSNGNTLTGGGHTFRYEFEDRLTQV